MTPADCLKATPEQLLPIIAKIMGGEWSLHIMGEQGYLQAVRRGVHAANMAPVFWPMDDYNDAFRLQDRVAELNLQLKFTLWFRKVLYEREPLYQVRAMPDWLAIWLMVVASPLDRTRACAAAYLESKEPNPHA